MVIRKWILQTKVTLSRLISASMSKIIMKEVFGRDKKYVVVRVSEEEEEGHI